MKVALKPEQIFPVENEYTRCVKALKSAGILTLLPESGCFGVIGTEGKEYPIPTKEQIVELFEHNSELVSRKLLQGFDCLEITPMAIPLEIIIERMKEAILKQAAEGKIYHARLSSSDSLTPVYVNKEKHVWIWETLKYAMDTDELVYFPQEYSDNHKGQTKSEVLNNKFICAFPGWSVGLVERLSVMPQQSSGKTLGGRGQLEIGFSPRDYLLTLRTKPYQGETGKTLEDFITKFITHLEISNEISYDRYDDNALWLLGQYVRYVNHLKSDLVPTGWWHRPFGRVRIDAHRPGNRLCTKSWGVSTIVRLTGY